MSKYLHEEIPGDLGTVVRYVMILGNLNCEHDYKTVPKINGYEGQCLVCKRCGRVETDPAPGEVCVFYGMPNISPAILEENGTPGMSVPRDA